MWNGRIENPRVTATQPNRLRASRQEPGSWEADNTISLTYNLGTLPFLSRRHIVPTNAPLNRKLRMGLIGGGQGAFIGRVHATAAVLDNRAALVAGALSSDPAI